MFIKISKKIEYALIVLHHLETNKDDKLTTARQISEKYATPFDTTAKVMQTLCNYGLLKSLQGVNGGYQLNKDLSQVNYLDIYEIVEGKKLQKDCQDMDCKLIPTCNISGPISNLNETLLYFFQGLSLKELFTSKSPNSIFNEVIYGQ